MGYGPAPGTAFAGRGRPADAFSLSRRERKDGDEGATARGQVCDKMSDSPASLRALAHKCRSLAGGGSTASVTAALNEIALDYDRQADRVEQAEARARHTLGIRGRLNGD